MKSWRVMRTTEPGTLNPGLFILRSTPLWNSEIFDTLFFPLISHIDSNEKSSLKLVL